MNIKDLPQGSYTPVASTTKKLNIKDLPAGSYTPVTTPTQPTEPQGYLSATGSDIKAIGGDISKRFGTAKTAIEKANLGEQSPVSAALQTVGQVAGGVGDIAYRGIKALAPEFVEQGVKKTIGAIAETKPVQDIAKGYGEFKQARPEAAANIEAVGNIASLFPIGKVGQLGVKATPEAIKKAGTIGEIAVNNLLKQSEKQIEGNVIKKFEKGVRPILPGKTTPRLLQNYRDDIVTAVKTIKENKPNLSFTDDAGEIIAGKTPKTLQQLSDSVEQTKKSIFTKYNAEAKQAGEAGLTVDMAPISGELNTVINNKALQITNPRAIQYARDIQGRLLETGKIDALTAQEVIQNYNKSLDAFYRNPTYDTASNAAIDSMVANSMRKTLDEGISGLTGTQYQALKNQYGALKSIEKDVIKASLRDARKNAKGLIDLTDIFSGGQVVSGILNLNPTMIATGVTQKSIASFYKYLNSPHRAIEGMFKASEKLPQLGKNSPKNSLLQTAVKPIIPNSINKKIIPPTIPQATPKSKLPAKPASISEQKLLSEARKYKTAEEFYQQMPDKLRDELRVNGVRGQEQITKFWEDTTGKKVTDSYKMSHRPTEGVSAFNLIEKVDGEQRIPQDMYTQWYGSRGTPADLESISVLKKIKGKPEADVTIYRASPKESFNEGDWVTFSKKYAQEHATGNNTQVFSKIVKAKDLRWAMNDVNEFGYFPKTRAQLTSIWEKAHKK